MSESDHFSYFAAIVDPTKTWTSPHKGETVFSSFPSPAPYLPSTEPPQKGKEGEGGGDGWKQKSSKVLQSLSFPPLTLRVQLPSLDSPSDEIAESETEKLKVEKEKEVHTNKGKGNGKGKANGQTSPTLPRGTLYGLPLGTTVEQAQSVLAYFEVIPKSIELKDIKKGEKRSFVACFDSSDEALLAEHQLTGKQVTIEFLPPPSPPPSSTSSPSEGNVEGVLKKEVIALKFQALEASLEVLYSTKYHSCSSSWLPPFTLL